MAEMPVYHVCLPCEACPADAQVMRLGWRALPDGLLAPKGALPCGVLHISGTLPPDAEAQVRPRSGLALRHGVTVLNAPGTIDAGYRGEVGVVLVNLGEAPFTVEKGMKVAQVVVAPVVRAAIVEVSETDATERGADGFGSTGV